MNGTVNLEHKLFGTVHSARHISGTIGQRATYSDHEVVTIDLFHLNEQVVLPISANTLYQMSSAEITTDVLVPVNYCLAAAEIQPETYTIIPVEGDFEEDIEL